MINYNPLLTTDSNNNSLNFGVEGMKLNPLLTIERTDMNVFLLLALIGRLPAEIKDTFLK